MYNQSPESYRDPGWSNTLPSALSNPPRDNFGNQYRSTPELYENRRKSSGERNSHSGLVDQETNSCPQRHVESDGGSDARTIGGRNQALQFRPTKYNLGQPPSTVSSRRQSDISRSLPPQKTKANEFGAIQFIESSSAQASHLRTNSFAENNASLHRHTNSVTIMGNISNAVLFREQRNLFLQCALSLCDRVEAISEPERSDIIRCGFLKKLGGKSSLIRWKVKYVEVKNGVMEWYPYPWQDVGKGLDVILTESMIKKKKQIKLTRTTDCRISLHASRKANHVFDVISADEDEDVDTHSISEYLQMYNSNEELSSPPSRVSESLTSSENSERVDESFQEQERPSSSHSTSGKSSNKATPHGNVTVKQFMCANDEDRDSWLRAIRTARLGRGKDSKSWVIQHIFGSVRKACVEAQSILEIQAAINPLLDTTIRVPVAFVQDFNSGMRKAAPDHQLKQAFRDLKRDTVVINGNTLKSDGKDSNVESLPAGVIYSLFKEIEAKSNDRHSPDEILMFVRKVLMYSNRTQAGGDAYDSVQALFGMQSLVCIVPDNREVVPIYFTITSDNPNCAQSTPLEEGPFVLSQNTSSFEVKSMDSRAPGKSLYFVSVVIESVINMDNNHSAWVADITVKKS